MKCRDQPCAHALGTLRARSRPRRAVVASFRAKSVWIPKLYCGHELVRPVAKYVYPPYRPVPRPRHCYCELCDAGIAP